MIELALLAKSGDVNAIEDLHNYYIGKLYEYYWLINSPNKQLSKLKMMISNIRIGNTLDYLNSFIYLGELVCEGKPISLVDINYLSDHINQVILLTNNTGHFTFEDYLKVHYAGYELIGVPVNISSYDNIKIGCPMDFIAHDASHLRYVNGNQTISEYMYPKYLRANDQPTLIVIWMYIHENGFKDSFHRHTHPFAFKDQLNALTNSLSNEFRKYLNIILTNDNVDRTIINMAKYVKYYGKDYVVLKKYQLAGYQNNDGIINNDTLIFSLGLNYGYSIIFDKH